MFGKAASASRNDAGFTLVEMLLASVVVLVGLVAVAQLVPTSVWLNSNNRNDGAALVFGQRQVEAMREQSLSSNTFTDPLGISCPLGMTCDLGDPAQPNQWVGSPVVLNQANVPIINFSAGTVPGYSFLYTDPNDPVGAAYDVRWAVVTMTNNSLVTGRRIIVGVFRRGMQTPALPISLDTMVER